MKIFLISGKAESGKDTFYELAKEVIDKKYPNLTPIRLAYGDGVKEIAKQMGWNGVKDEKGRSGLIMIGDGARKCFDPNIWINKLIETLDSNFSQSPYENKSFKEDVIFVTDCRYPNEITLIRKWAKRNGHEVIAIRVERYGHKSKLTEEQLLNSSETALDDFEFDYYAYNDTTLDHYKKRVRHILSLVYEGK